MRTGSFDENLFSVLKHLRKTLADKGNLRPYVIFNDCSLREMARVSPVDKEISGPFPGVGNEWKNRPRVLAEIRAFRKEHHPEMPPKVS